MPDSQTPLPLRWREKYVASSNTGIPNSPGVYAIGYRETLHGLDLNRIYVYVGESKDLYRRLDEHLPETEQNSELRTYLRHNYTSLVCWYLPTTASQRKKIQDDLIRTIQPQFNTIGL